MSQNMMVSIGQSYLEQVLGLKNLPQPLLWPQVGSRESVEVANRYSFGVYTPEASEPDLDLLRKMMNAIGVEDFPLISSREDFPLYIHVLCFSDDIEIFDLESRLWKFRPLKAYREGSATEINLRKRQAWEQLQIFKREAL